MSFLYCLFNSALKFLPKERIDAYPIPPRMDFVITDLVQQDGTLIAVKQDGFCGAAHFIGSHELAPAFR